MITNCEKSIRLALFQPDLAPNVGMVIRTCACMGLPLDIIEPCGFPFSLGAVRSRALDYAEHAEIAHHASWTQFEAAREGRLVAMTTRGASDLWDFSFRAGDVLLIGRESAGLPEEVHEAADARLRIPMKDGVRSLNMAVSAAIAGVEALRQLRVAV